MKAASLSTTLLTNSASSALTGTLLLTIPVLIGDFMGGISPWILRLVGIGLLLFAVGAYLVKRGLPTSGPWVAAVLIFDIAWIVATPAIMTTFAQELSIWGHLLLTGVALIVTLFSVLEWYWLRRMWNTTVTA